MCGILALLCTIGLMGLPETMNANLNDKLEKRSEQIVSQCGKKDKVNKRNANRIDGLDNGNEQNLIEETTIV